MLRLSKLVSTFFLAALCCWTIAGCGEKNNEEDAPMSEEEIDDLDLPTIETDSGDENGDSGDSAGEGDSESGESDGESTDGDEPQGDSDSTTTSQ